jgi:hypothetical protein
MAVGEAYGFCEHCQAPARFLRNTPNHCLHFLLSTVTLGLWSFVWLLCGVRATAWRCCRCHRRTHGLQRLTGGAPPALTPRVPLGLGGPRPTGGSSFSLKLIGSGLVFYVPTGATFRFDTPKPASAGLI